MNQVKSPDHRALWLVIIGLSLSVCVSNGFARFAYGLILPAMQTDLGWNYAQAGWINTANAIGYMIGAGLTLMISHRVDQIRLFSWGMVGMSITLVLTGLTDNLVLLSALRILTGIFGAFTFITGGGLATRLFSGNARKNAMAIAVYYGGGGVGMVLSGLALPGFFATQGAHAWPWSWVALGLASALFAVLSIWAAGWLDDHARTSEASEPQPLAIPQGKSGLPLKAMILELTGYAFFAIGYIVYLTFLVAWMQALGASPLLVSTVWAVIGIGVIVSPFIWRPVLAYFDGGAPLGLSNMASGFATLIAAVWTSHTGLLLSAALFGAAVFIGPASTTAFSRKNLSRQKVSQGIALFTFVFAAGQVVGPVAAGVIGDAAGSIENGLIAAGLVLITGGAIAMFQKPLK